MQNSRKLLCRYCKTLNRSPQLLLEHVTLTPGLYPGSSIYLKLCYFQQEVYVIPGIGIYLLVGLLAGLHQMLQVDLADISGVG